MQGGGNLSHAGYHTELDCMCQNCELRYKKYFTWDQWCNLRKLDSKKLVGDKEYYQDAQEVLCKKYNIIISDYLPPWERRKKKLQKLLKKLKLFLSKLDSLSSGKGISLSDIFGDTNQTKSKPLKQIDYSFLLGNSKSKKRNMDFIIGKNPRDYSALLGKPNRKRKRQKNNDDYLEKFWGKRK